MKVKSLTKEEIENEIAALEKTVNCVSHNPIESDGAGKESKMEPGAGAKPIWICE